MPIQAREDLITVRSGWSDMTGFSCCMVNVGGGDEEVWQEPYFLSFEDYICI